MKIGSVVVGVWMVLAGVGCGGGPVGSCPGVNITNAGTACLDYGVGYDGAKAMRLCSQSGGTYAASAPLCTTTGRVGRCVLDSSAFDMHLAYTINYYAPVTAADAMANCTLNANSAQTATFTAN